MKQLKVADLFDIRQTKGESLKTYLARFNNAMVQVNDPDQKRPTSIGEIRAQAEKHIEVEEDLADRLEAEHQPMALQEMKSDTSKVSKEETRY
ncbi:hypothetical protein CR513_00138, partial [Mucuna pruriens]